MLISDVQDTFKDTILDAVRGEGGRGREDMEGAREGGRGRGRKGGGRKGGGRGGEEVE